MCSCISDENKKVLVECAALMIPLLVSACFLDPDHVRKDADDSEKAPVQADAAECFLQLAAFEPGRKLLTESRLCYICC
eukprot:COSAG06_NODE_1275_length_10046_cov_4.285915_2_plen_79_part_00